MNINSQKVNEIELLLTSRKFSRALWLTTSLVSNARVSLPPLDQIHQRKEERDASGSEGRKDRGGRRRKGGGSTHLSARIQPSIELFRRDKFKIERELKWEQLSNGDKTVPQALQRNICNPKVGTFFYVRHQHNNHFIRKK